MIDPSPVPTGSVIISMRDMAETVGAAVRSIICQTLTEWELILIDDGSRDDGAARVAAFGDPRIRIIRHETSRGIACRRNEAARLARGEFIAVTDADDICYPERLAVQVAMLRSDPMIDLLASKALVFRRQGEIVGFFATPSTHEQIAANPYRGFLFPHPTWCGRAAWFRKHPYDERISRTADQDLLLRSMASSRFAAADKVLLGYRREHISLSKRYREWLQYSYAVWRHAWQVRDRRRATKQIAAHFYRLARVTVIIGLGGEERRVKWGTPTLDPEVLAQWQVVWSMTSGVGDTGGPTHDTMPALAQSVPIVSVIISMRDMAETVGVAVRSIICQTLTDWELILIDDGSRDDGAARVAAFGDPRIRIIRHETSRGIACRHNEAARLARGEFIAVMDADDICYPERLAVQVAMLRSDPTIDVVASQAVVFRGQGEVVGSNPYPLTHDQITANPYKGFPFLHATWCGKTAWFRSHPYDERLWRAEDMGLLLSAAATSRFATVDKILFAYRREHISLSKKYIGLASYSRAVWWHARRTRNRRRAVKQILAFVARIASDAVIIGLGGGERLFKQRHMPLTNAEALTRWQAVWSMMSGAGEIGGPTHDTMQALAQPVPTVSLVMSMRDMAATVEAAVRSIIYQTLTEWELVLIDDGSRDDSAARVAAFGDSRIRIIRHKRSKGLACRLNEAVRLARGEFIARMDADDICYPERLAVQVEMLRSDPTIDLLGSKAWIFRRQGEIVGFLSTPATHDQIASEPYRGLTLPHPTWCGKAAWFRNHPYDERVRKAEDQDLLMRTAGSSRFAATDKILLGYRREHISILKRLRRRMSFSHAIWRHAQQTRDRRRAVKRIVERFKSLAADAVTIVLSGEEHLVKLEATSLLNPDDLARWRAVWTAVSDNMPAESQRG